MYKSVISILSMPLPLLLSDVHANRALLKEAIVSTKDIVLREKAMALFRAFDRIQIIPLHNGKFAIPAVELRAFQTLAEEVLLYCEQKESKNTEVYLSILTLLAGEAARFVLVEFLPSMQKDVTDPKLCAFIDRYLNNTDPLFDMLTDHAKKIPEIATLLKREKCAKIDLITYCNKQLATRMFNMSDEEFEFAVIIA